MPGWSRTPDGSYNDLSAPRMGAVGAAFGRNLPPVYRPARLRRARTRSRSAGQLLTREHFLPARSLNLLAAAWIQFQVHDWVNHARHPLGSADVVVPLPDGMTWQNTPGGDPEHVMRIAGNSALAGRPGRQPAALRQHRLALVGRLGGLRLRRGEEPRRCARARRSG